MLSILLIAGTPILPTKSTFFSSSLPLSFAIFKMCAMRDEVVLFPFDPVTPTIVPPRETASAKKSWVGVIIDNGSLTIDNSFDGLIPGDFIRTSNVSRFVSHAAPRRFLNG